MAKATTKGVRQVILKGIEASAEMTITATSKEAVDYARATLDLTSAYMNIHVIAPEDA